MPVIYRKNNFKTYAIEKEWFFCCYINNTEEERKWEKRNPSPKKPKKSRIIRSYLLWSRKKVVFALVYLVWPPMRTWCPMRNLKTFTIPSTATTKSLNSLEKTTWPILKCMNFCIVVCWVVKPNLNLKLPHTLTSSTTRWRSWTTRGKLWLMAMPNHPSTKMMKLWFVKPLNRIYPFSNFL